MKTYAQLAEFFGLKLNRKFRIRFVGAPNEGEMTVGEYEFRENGIYKVSSSIDIKAVPADGIITLLMFHEIVPSPWFPQPGDQLYIIDASCGKGYTISYASSFFLYHMVQRGVKFFETEEEAKTYVKEVLKWELQLDREDPENWKETMWKEGE